MKVYSEVFYVTDNAVYQMANYLVYMYQYDTCRVHLMAVHSAYQIYLDVFQM